jgi:hypothetical protein
VPPPRKGRAGQRRRSVHGTRQADGAETIFSLIASNPFVTGDTIVIDGGYAATS